MKIILLLLLFSGVVVQPPPCDIQGEDISIVWTYYDACRYSIEVITLNGCGFVIDSETYYLCQQECDADCWDGYKILNRN